MAKTGERKINPAGIPAQFLEEEDYRGRLPNRSMVTPMPHFSQPDTGAHHSVGGSLDMGWDIAAQRMKIGNDEKDLNGGYY